MLSGYIVIVWFGTGTAKKIMKISVILKMFRIDDFLLSFSYILKLIVDLKQNNMHIFLYIYLVHQIIWKKCAILGDSSSFQYELPRLKLKFGERSFSFSGPKAWNSLPSNLQELTNTDTFKKLLKTHLFKLAFGELEWLCWCTIGHCRCN